MKALNIIYFLALTIFIAGCNIEKHDLTGTDPIFRSDENINTSAALIRQEIPIEMQTRLTNWIHADYKSEETDINNFFFGSFKVVDKIDFGFASRNRYSRISNPIVANGIIYIANGAGTIIAIDLNDGNKEIWSKNIYSLGRTLSSFASFLTVSLSYYDDKIFIITNDGFAASVSAKTGDKNWSTELSYPFRSPLKFSDNMLFGVSSSNKVFALNADNGKTVWTYDHTQTQKVVIKKPSILVLDDKVVAGFSTGDAVALSKSKGATIWETTVTYKDGDNLFRMTDIQTTPAKVGDLVMLGGINGNVIFVNANNGQIVSGYLGSISSSVVSAGDFVFFLDSESRLICLHIPSGGIKWFTEFKNSSAVSVPSYLNAGNSKIIIKHEYGGPIMANSKLVINNQFGEMYVVDPQSGNIEKTVQIPKDIHNDPIIVNGEMFLVDDSAGKIIVMQ